VLIHWNEPSPIHVAAKGVVIEERCEGRGWQLAEEIDFERSRPLPELVVGRVEGRSPTRTVTCFINNIGLGYQFAAAGSVVYARRKSGASASSCRPTGSPRTCILDSAGSRARSAEKEGEGPT
jgi:hypothetical protein